MRKITVSSCDLRETLDTVKLNPNLHNSVFYKGTHKDITVFYAGIAKVNSRIGEVWFHLLDKSFIETPRVIKALIDTGFEMGYERIQSSAFAQDHTAHRFILYQGFQQEGTLRHFGVNNEDLNVYSKLKEGVWQEQHQ